MNVEAALKIQEATGLSFQKCEGYLYKHVREAKFLSFGNFNLRYFELNVQ